MINEHIKIGQINTLQILRATPPGLYLCANNEDMVLLPNIYVTNEMYIDDLIDVFIYNDSEDRLVATTLTPKGMLDDLVALKVVDVMMYGAFMDIGLAKDLLIPKNHQKTIFSVGDVKVVKIMRDDLTNRLFGSEKFSQNLITNGKSFEQNQEVQVIPYSATPLGYKVIINETHQGLIYKNEIFKPINIGDRLIGYIKKKRTDNKIDVSLQSSDKKESNNLNSDLVFDILNNDELARQINYKSDPQIIQNKFTMSKKNFKKALTTLLENKKIQLEDNNIIIL